MIDFAVLAALVIGGSRLPGIRSWATRGSLWRAVAFVLASWSLYYVVGVGVFGRTLGGLLTGLRTVSLASGERPGLVRALIRWLVILVGFPLLLVPFMKQQVWEAIGSLQTRTSRTIDLLNADSQKLNAIDAEARSQLLTELAARRPAS
jgi:hypothetical protein